MNADNEYRGYTIVEVMIFLAVSGLMFVFAATFVSGKQQQVEFRQGMFSINAEVQQVINDVSNGFFPSNNNFNCTASTSSPVVQISYTASATGQGTNLGCTFLGKVIQFGVGGAIGSQYNVYTVAGSQYAGGASSGSSPTSFSNALPTTIDSNGPGVSGVNFTEKNNFEGGIQDTAMYECDHSTNTCDSNTTAIGFFSTFGNLDSSGNLQSGSQSVQVVTIPSTPYGTISSNAMPGEIDTGLVSASLATPNSNYVQVCFKGGGSSQYGLLTIGDQSGQRVTTNVQIATIPPQVNSSIFCPS